MTIPVFPSFPGLAYPVASNSVWSTILQKSSSGKNTGIKLFTFPQYHWTLDFEILREHTGNTEFTTFKGLVDTVAGQGDVFFFTDPDDCSVTAQPNGAGDGATVAFQLERTLGGFSMPVQSINGTPTIYLNGTPTAAFTLGNTGIVTFTVAPGDGVAISWTGNYYWLCRFDADDAVKFSKFADKRWEAKSVGFTSEKQ